MSKNRKGYCPVFGNYPAEYNRAVHGPYYPWVDYRPNRDTPFYDVKLGELKSWISRRDKTPQAAIAYISRQWFTWDRKWYSTRYGSPSKPILQFLVLLSTGSMFCCYGLLKMHRNHKYHW